MEAGGFSELPADIRDKSGEVVGYSFVELLPGVFDTKNILGAALHG
jgi:hypothetical protein